MRDARHDVGYASMYFATINHNLWSKNNLKTHTENILNKFCLLWF